MNPHFLRASLTTQCEVVSWWHSVFSTSWSLPKQLPPRDLSCLQMCLLPASFMWALWARASPLSFCHCSSPCAHGLAWELRPHLVSGCAKTGVFFFTSISEFKVRLSPRRSLCLQGSVDQLEVTWLVVWDLDLFGNHQNWQCPLEAHRRILKTY